MIAFVMNAVAQDKTTMVETHDFTGFNNGASISWGEQSGNDLNSSWDKVTLLSITSNVNGVSTTRNYYSWIDGKPRFSVGRATDWQYWDNGWQMTQENAKTFFINRLDAGDKVTIEYRTDQTLRMISENTSLSSGAQIISGQEFTVNRAGGVEIECSNRWAVIYKVTIATKHLATYVIDHQTYTFTSGGVLPDKRKAVPYITMTFGNENMDYAYVKYYGEENGVKQFGSFMITENMNDITDSYYQGKSNEFIGNEYTVFKGNNFSEYVPWHGTYYYFYPETNGRLYVHWHSDPVTKQLDTQSWKHDVIFLWDKTTNDIGNSYSVEYDEGEYKPNTTRMSPPFYKFATEPGTNPQEHGVRVLKNHVYFMCISPLDLRRRNVAHLLDYTFIPDFTMTPLYKVVDHAASPTEQNPLEVSELEYTDHMDPTTLHYRVKKCLGNIESAQVKIEDGKLYFTNITYKSGDNVNKGGSVIVDVDCTDGQADFVLTVPYSAEPSDGTGNQVKTWDFYNNIIDNAAVDYNQVDNNGQIYDPFVNADAPMMGKIHLGQWKDHESDKVSGLYYETEKDPGEWLNTYIDLENSKEPIFKNVYDVEGDNADMIWDTNGLIIHAPSGATGIYNENDLSTSGFSDRYIGLMPGSKLVIPGLKANDRVVIKMGCYGNADNTVENTNAILKLTNAKDAIGTTISGDYIIGGSMPYPDETGDAKTQPHGEYHFIVASNSTSEENDFAIEVAEGTDLLKIYSITIYTNSDIVTENELIGDLGVRQIVNTSEFSNGDNITVYPRYRGLKEHTNYVAAEAKTGNLEDDDIKMTGNGNVDLLKYSFYLKDLPTAANPKFGVFKARQGVQTFKDDESNEYVTDYAECLVPVGFRESKTYPYTWDFTDLKKYVSAGIDENGTEKIVTDTDLQIWKDWSLRVESGKWNGNIFASGGQLYGGTTMFEETRGIGITYSNNNKTMTMTGTNTDETGGLAVNNQGTYGFIVPQVGNGQAIYVHATPVGDSQSATYHISDGETTYNYDSHSENEKTFTGTGTYTATDANGDKIFAVKLSQKRDVRLSFKGYEVKKIAVSTAPKTLSAKGWTSESRAYVTDPSLTSYMTGKKFRTYIVSDVNYSTKTVTLTRIDNADNACLMPAAANDGDKNACVILNGTADSGIEGSSAGVFDSQFHLFAPDMHDYGTKTGVTYLKSLYDTSGSKMKAQLNPGTVNAVDGDYTNFAFTCMYYDLVPETGEILSNTKKEGPQAFYRIAGGKTGTASSIGNQGYLPILTSEVGYPKDTETGATGPAGARFTLVIIDDNEATGIATVERIVQDGRFYNLNGQQLDGTPNRSGLYIVNGKKVYIKNK